MYIVDTNIVKIIIKKLMTYINDKLSNPYKTNKSIKNNSINGKSILNKNNAKKIELQMLIPKNEINNKKIRTP